MRLLHVVPTYFPAVRYGGPIHSVHGLCAALALRGHDVQVFTTNVDGPGDSAVPLGRPVAMDGVKVWYFPSRRLRRLYWSPAMGRMLKHEVGGFDLVHLHSVFLWPTWAAARAARRAGVPYVLSPRGMLVKDLVRARSRCAKSAWLAAVERANLAGALGVHVTSAVERAEFEKFGFRMSGRVFEVPNGVVVQAAFPMQRDPQSPYLVMLGRINWKKRIDMALEVLKLLDGVRLVIAGGDDDHLAAALRDRAAALGVGERVAFAGPVDGLRKRQLLHGALAFLMPSLSENFGNSALEAMAEGTPVIVVPQVGIADSIRESGSGFVVAPDAAAFADAVRQLQEDGDLRARMSERARETVAAQFSWHAIGLRMENEYRAILSDFRRSS
jgi:glycosyltransferase involved in cell wall biosynthesis